MLKVIKHTHTDMFCFVKECKSEGNTHIDFGKLRQYLLCDKHTKELKELL